MLDNCPECTSNVLDKWAYRRSVELASIRLEDPVENAVVESFDGRFRAECLGLHWSSDVADARRTIERWRRDFNHVRPYKLAGQPDSRGGWL